MKLEYWIKFPNSSPFRIYAKDMLEFFNIVSIEITRHGIPFEWLIGE